MHVSGYDLLVEDSALNINEKSSILLSRNHPIAVVVGAAGFLGSHLTERLLEHGIQVIGVDNFATSRRENLSESFKNKNFHFLHQSIEETQVEKNLEGLPRLDYAIFIAENPTTSALYKTGLQNFLDLIKLFKNHEEHHKSDEIATAKSPVFGGKSKIVFVSSIQIYDQTPEGNLNYLKSAENQFAKFIKQNGLNGRVVRLSEVYGPRMHFREAEAFSRLIKSSLEGKLAKEEITLDFSTRGLFIEDAISLILKSILSGSTSGKIYDGCLPQPIKVEEVKQILLNPHWHFERGFTHIELPPWPTPNLERSVKELSWKPKVSLVKGLKETIDFFDSDGEAKIFALKQKRELEEQKKITGWSFASINDGENEKTHRHKSKKSHKTSFFWFICLLVILLGLFYPILSFVLGAYALPASLVSTKQAVEAGDLPSAKRFLEYAHISNGQMNNISSFLNALTKTGLVGENKEINQLLTAQNEGIKGIGLSLEALDQSSKILEEGGVVVDPELFLNSQTQLSSTLAILANENLKNSILIPNRPQITESATYQYFYDLSEKGRWVSTILPLLFGDQEKNYLLLISENSTLQPQGGKLSQIGEIKFEQKSISAGALKPVSELDQLLAQKNILLSQNNLSTPAQFSTLTSADFPTFAQNIKSFYQALFNSQIDGVIMVDESVINKIKQLTGLRTEENPTLTETLTRGLSRQYLFKSVQILDLALIDEQMVLFSSDNRLQNILSNLNWESSVKSQTKEEGFVDYLSVLENNHSLASNDLLSRKLSLTTKIEQDGGVSHVLTISYDNKNPQVYLSSLQMILPLGAKINSAKVGELQTVFSSTVDFGRAIYTGEISINPGVETLIIEYSLPQKLEVVEQTTSYSLKINKQPGSAVEQFNWQLSYPFSWDLVSKIKGVDTTKRQINVESNLDTDKTFELLFKKN